MSADNRLLYYYWPKTQKWHVWDGSASYDYFEPPEYSEKFDTREEVSAYIDNLYKTQPYVSEYGVQELTQEEINRGLKEEELSKTLKTIQEEENSHYCPTCECCGEDPCCSGSRCEQNKCFYGERYAAEYEYNKELVSKLYVLAHSLNPKETDKIFHELWNKNFGTGVRIYDNIEKLKKELLSKSNELIGWTFPFRTKNPVEILNKLADLEKKNKELEIELKAWYSQFGTQQLSHAISRLEKAEKEVEILEQIISDLRGD